MASNFTVLLDLVTIALILATTHLPVTSAVAEQRPTCFASSASSSLCHSKSKCRSNRPELSTSTHNQDNSDRRSVLRDVLVVSSALLVPQFLSTSAEAKSPKKAAKSIMNFPRVHPGLRVGSTTSGVLCEVFIDFTCPYSRKLFTAVSSPEVSDAYGDRMAFTFHHVIQPWHHQSLWLHESAFAVRFLYPQAELAYWKALFGDAPNWYDKEIYGLTRGDFYDKIATFAAGAVVAAEVGNDLEAGEVKGRILQYLVPPKQKGGNFPDEARDLLGSGPGDDENAVFPFTRQVVKFQRKRGVHVTPTVFFNGIEQTQISSSWTADEWTEFLDRALS